MKANGTPAVKKNEGEPTKKGKNTKKNSVTKSEEKEIQKEESEQ